METPNAEEKSERWVWWRWVLWTAVIVGIVPLLYLEEDLRGAMAWAGTKKYWEDKGETFDYAKFAPPPVPDDKNLALIPLFALKPDSGSSLSMPTLDTAMRYSGAQLDLPKFGDWTRGDRGDQKAWRKTLEDDYKSAALKTPVPAEDLAIFDTIWPFTATVRAEAVKRNQYRLPMDYAMDPPILRPFGPITRTIKLCQLMTGHGTLAVEVGKMDLALEDVRVNFMLLSSAEKDPTLVGSLVAMGISAINGGIIYRGLFRHAWNDAQLAEIDEKLRSVDFLEDFQSVLRAESAMSANDLPYFKRTSGKDLMSWAGSPAMEGLALGPKGWWNINAAQIVDLHFEQMEQVDLSKRIVLVKKAKAMKARMDAFCDSWQGTCLPWNAWYSVSGGAETNITKRFARAQVWVDEMRIAIALERYRLAQGALPAKLEMLAPQYLDAVPHDIMDGNPYHYVLNADGTYLLYSIGWNELDEGGVVVYESENPKAIDENEGDWVWPMPKK